MHTVTLEGREIPVGKIIGIGRNYAEHARELGNEIPIEQPILFMKPANTLVANGGAVTIPSHSDNCHYEAELAVLIGEPGKEIPVEQAMSYVAGYGVCLDLTLRDVQSQQKEKGLPWEIAKAFDTSCPVSEFVSVDRIADVQNLQIRLTRNDELKQDGNTGDMIRPVRQLISEVSRYFSLEKGDIIMTGTPAGVGRIESGDRLVASIDGVGTLAVTVA